LIEGARLYLKDGLGSKPDAVLEATKEYVDDNNILGRFIADRLEPAEGGKIRSSDLYHGYFLWCMANKEEPQPQKHFPKVMAERGVRSKRESAGTFFIGYRMKVATKANGVVRAATVRFKAPYVDDYPTMSDEDARAYNERA
jgi:putative DNA primase/helicase